MIKINLSADSYKNLFLAFLTSLFLSLSFPPFKTGFFAYFGLVPILILLVRVRSYSQVLKYTYFSMLVFHAFTLFWVGGWDAKADLFMILGSIALILIHPIFYWIPFLGFYFTKQKLGLKTALWGFPFFWNSLEYLRSVDETAFPWLTLGHTQSYYLPIIQVTSVIGVYGLSFIIVVFNVLIYTAYKNFRYESFRFSINKIAVLLIILLTIFIYGKIVLNDAIYDGKKLVVGVVQPNFDPWGKWEDDVETQLDVYLSLTDSAVIRGAKIVFWPESALPVYLLGGSYPILVQQIREYVQKNNVAIVTGIPLVHFYYSKEGIKRDTKVSRDSSYYYDTYNGVVLFLPNDSKIQQYGKMKLVPFAERAPFLHYLPFLGDLIKWGVGISNWSVWDEFTIFKMTNENGDTIKFSSVVCYESIFPDFNAEFVRRGAQFISVLTNDSWYGRLAGPYQHKQFAVFRAVENRKWVVRSANGGISCIIDPFGRTIRETNLYERTFFIDEIYINNDLTYYVKYRDRISHISLFISVILILIGISKIGGKKIEND